MDEWILLMNLLVNIIIDHEYEYPASDIDCFNIGILIFYKAKYLCQVHM